VLPLSTVPVVGSSSLNVTVWPLTKFATLPLSVAGSDETVVEELNASDGEPTVTLELRGLSAPTQLLCRGVTEYFHVPGGNAASAQVNPLTVPEQEDPIACKVPPPS
jgi:hypothetical protein